jgi:hypothetical protein
MAHHTQEKKNAYVQMQHISNATMGTNGSLNWAKADLHTITSHVFAIWIWTRKFRKQKQMKLAKDI